MIDLQRGFMCPATTKIPAAVRALCERTHFEHRIFTRFVNPDDSSMVFRRWPEPHSEQESELVAEISHLPTLVVDKFTYSPFVAAAMGETLTGLGIRDIAVCGIDTDACVLAAVLGLMGHRIQTTVLSDLTASADGSSSHEAALRICTRVVHSDKITAATH